MQYFDFCQGFRSVAMFGVYIFITIAMWRCVAFYLLHSRFGFRRAGAGEGYGLSSFDNLTLVVVLYAVIRL